MSQEDIFNNIHQRASIRLFTDEEIEDDILVKIAEAGRASPTANNKQNRTFTIVKNKEYIKKLAEVIGKETNREDYNFYSPAAIILISVPDASPYSILEVGAATQNVMLAATALKLGSVWTSQIKGITDRPNVRGVLDTLNIPSNHLCFNVIALGYPAEDPEAKQRTEKIRLIS